MRMKRFLERDLVAGGDVFVFPQRFRLDCAISCVELFGVCGLADVRCWRCGVCV